MVLGFRVQGLRFRVWGLGFGVERFLWRSKPSRKGRESAAESRDMHPASGLWV